MPTALEAARVAAQQRRWHAVLGLNPGASADEVRKARRRLQLTAHADRVKHIAPADYRPGSHLRLLLEEMIMEIADSIVEGRREDLEAATVRAPKH